LRKLTLAIVMVRVSAPQCHAWTVFAPLASA
jgi:hypothetical protein